MRRKKRKLKNFCKHKKKRRLSSLFICPISMGIDVVGSSSWSCMPSMVI
nr:MAG TPA: hypothetical protein [Bacteriophage sp.]